MQRSNAKKIVRSISVFLDRVEYGRDLKYSGALRTNKPNEPNCLYSSSSSYASCRQRADYTTAIGFNNNNMTVNWHIFPIRCGFFFFLFVYLILLFTFCSIVGTYENTAIHRTDSCCRFLRSSAFGVCIVCRTTVHVLFRTNDSVIIRKWNDTVCTRLPKRNSYSIACRIFRIEFIVEYIATGTNADQQQKKLWTEFVGRQRWRIRFFFARPINEWHESAKRRTDISPSSFRSEETCRWRSIKSTLFCESHQFSSTGRPRQVRTRHLTELWTINMNHCNLLEVSHCDVCKWSTALPI